MGTTAGRRPVGMRWRIGAPVGFGVIVLVAWQVASWNVPPTILPAPGDVVIRLANELARGDLLGGTVVTLAEAILGCALATVVGLPLGILVGLRPWADAAWAPYLAASQAIPAVAVAPLLVIWVGYGLFPIVWLCSLLVFFPMVLATRHGLLHLDDRVVAAAMLDGASGWRLLTEIKLPLAASSILVGIRNGFTLSITGAVVGEMVMGGNGLGLTLATYAASTDTTGLFATLVVLCALAVGLYLALVALEGAIDPLRPGRLASRKERS